MAGPSLRPRHRRPAWSGRNGAGGARSWLFSRVCPASGTAGRPVDQHLDRLRVDRDRGRESPSGDVRGRARGAAGARSGQRDPPRPAVPGVLLCSRGARDPRARAGSAPRHRAARLPARAADPPTTTGQGGGFAMSMGRSGGLLPRWSLRGLAASLVLVSSVVSPSAGAVKGPRTELTLEVHGRAQVVTLAELKRKLNTATLTV